MGVIRACQWPRPLFAVRVVVRKKQDLTVAVDEQHGAGLPPACQVVEVRILIEARVDFVAVLFDGAEQHRRAVRYRLDESFAPRVVFGALGDG